eukprot:1768465-Pleurochrysis_carterae.AAC.1
MGRQTSSPVIGRFTEVVSAVRSFQVIEEERSRLEISISEVRTRILTDSVSGEADLPGHTIEGAFVQSAVRSLVCTTERVSALKNDDITQVCKVPNLSPSECKCLSFPCRIRF